MTLFAWGVEGENQERTPRGGARRIGITDRSMKGSDMILVTNRRNGKNEELPDVKRDNDNLRRWGKARGLQFPGADVWSDEPETTDNKRDIAETE